MKNVAFLIDGGYLSKVIFKKTGKHIIPSEFVPTLKSVLKDGEELYRVYYYDAPPYEGILTNPVDDSEMNYGETKAYQAITNFQRELAEQDYVALRKGQLKFKGWKLTREMINKIKAGIKLSESEIEEARGGRKLKLLQSADFAPVFKQKGVDMKIGLDIAWLSTASIVYKIVLLTADNDFVPAMKFARREGVHVAVTVIEDLSSEMKQHADEIIPLSIDGFINQGDGGRVSELKSSEELKSSQN